MDSNDAILTCVVNIQWTNAVGAVGRKLAYKGATLRLIRNDIKELFIELSTEKIKPLKFKMKDIMVHKKFMSEGKASINFKAEKCTMYLSNAPPGTLMYFLRTLFIKINGGEKLDEGTAQKQLRAHMLSGNPSKFEEVSPVTTMEMAMARKRAALTPSSGSLPLTTSKRRYDEIKDNTIGEKDGKPAAKKLYQESSSITAEESVKLCQEQMDVLRACISGKNVFFTGSAGTGKSFLLKKIISALPPDGTVATASTGVAACLIGGVTLHAFAGIGGGDAILQRCYEMASRPSTAQAWRKCKRLIIDEISMVDGNYFDKIEAVARHVRRNDRPFGGIQLVLCGDFLQLPPVIKREEHFSSSGSQTSQRFCFQSTAWENCIENVFELKEVHRQSDPEFIKILNHLRIGRCTDEITKRLVSTSKQRIEGNGILATQLCSHTNDANSINESKLENLSGDKILFKAEDSDALMTKQLDSQVQAPSLLYLKLNAQVMLLKNINISAGLVNGARGVVVRFEKGIPVVRFKNNNEYLCKHEKWIIKTPMGGSVIRSQIPLKLAWAFSIHKSQGLTLDCVEMSLSKVFEAGQAYVALSRAKSLESVRILDFDTKQVWANSQVLQYYKLFRRRLQDTTMIPLGVRNSAERKKASADKLSSALVKLKRNVMDKPLVSIS